jgi:hypothetical protein
MSTRKPAQRDLPFDPDVLTPRNHPLRSTTDLRRDQRVVGERLREHYLRKYRKAA